MVVQHNLKAMNSNRMLNINTKASARSTEKLSSGYRVNRAADDAAGLAISEKMRKQIRGLTQGSRNAEDGISAVQTAEGALAEVQDMLQRMNELCVQAANGTNSITDRQYIQDEIDQLVTEMDRISETTKFNELYLLKGDKEEPEELIHTFNYITDDEIDTTGLSNVTLESVTGDKNGKVNYNSTENVYVVKADIATSNSSKPITADVITKGSDYTKYLDSATIGTSSSVKAYALNTNDYIAFKNTDLEEDDLETDATGNIKAAADDTHTYIFDMKTKNIIHLNAKEALNDYIEYNDVDQKYVVKEGYSLLAEADGGTSAGTTIGKAVEGERLLNDTTTKKFIGAKAERVLYDADKNPVAGMALYKYFDDAGNYTGGLFSDPSATMEVKKPTNPDPAADIKNPEMIDFYVSDLTEKITAPLVFSVHAGSDSDLNNRISAKIETMSAAGLGVNKLKSTSIGIVDATGENAREAIDVVAEGLKIVSTQRSILGAVQNRLEHTIANLDNVVENTTAAESAIRDTDMAEEMVTFSNNQVLMQAGQSILAQANQSNQGVLSLLQ